METVTLNGTAREIIGDSETDRYREIDGYSDTDWYREMDRWRQGH